MSRRNETIIIGGSVAQKPHEAGHTWQFLQYLLGFRRLGFDVVLVDRLDADMCVDRQGRRCRAEDSVNVAYFRDVAARFDLEDSYAIFYDGGAKSIGLTLQETLRRTRDSVLLLNVMGFVNHEEVLAAAATRVFLDTDPGYGQIWQAMGLADVFRDHDAYVTIAGNIGQRDCSIPTCGIKWITTAQPVVLDEWTTQNGGSSGRFTSVGMWRGPYAPLEYEGRVYGQRVHEFRKFFELPIRAPAEFELALRIDPADERDLVRLRENRWSLADPREVAARPDVYREYIQKSKAEFMVARGMYVEASSGWFSERSMCYLASGKPVLAQDTGLQDLYPLGEGLISYSTLEEAIAGVVEITRNYDRHVRAARGLAEEFFDSDKVLMRLLDRLGVA